MSFMGIDGDWADQNHNEIPFHTHEEDYNVQK